MCIETRIDLMTIFFLSRSGIYIVWMDGWVGWFDISLYDCVFNLRMCDGCDKV
jgi:hypothetical protein